MIFIHDDITIYSIAKDHPIPHRLDGAAVIFKNGLLKWAILGKEISVESQEEFNRVLKMKVFW